MSNWKESFIRLEHNSKRYKGRKEDLDTVFAELKKAENLDDLMKKYELGSLKELEKIISDFDSCCQDLINVMGFVAALQSFIDSKGLTPESKQFVRKYMESLKKEGK